MLDGPMGTEINRRGGDTTLPLWSARALLENPSIVQQIHMDFLDAGSDILTTNTFRTQYRTLANTGIGSKAEKITKLAVDLAIKAREEKSSNALIAGSIAPLEDCYNPHLVPEEPVLRKEHKRMVQWLGDSGIDLFLIETMNTKLEALTAMDAALDYDLPIWLSFTCDDNGKILGGDTWESVYQETEGKIDIILVNCSSLLATQKAIRKMTELGWDRIGAYPNFGIVDPVVGWKSGLIPNNFETFVNSLLGEKTVFALGTCCGATPKETHQMKQIIINREN
ncbi:MAG: homocysteine S-methyltransferase family protein [Candidatus Kariarchaeaceae archaeon]